MYAYCYKLWEGLCLVLWEGVGLVLWEGVGLVLWEGVGLVLSKVWEDVCLVSVKFGTVCVRCYTKHGKVYNCVWH